MSANIVFTKENLDECLSKLAKEYRKLNGTKVTAEIILIGGAAVLANYGFRDMTYDIDAIVRATASMKDAVNKVGDERGLPNGWLNSDFIKTKSYSAKLLQYSKYYKRFGHVLEVRTVSREYLVAMKLMSGRQYKNDISDIIGILHEEKENGNPISLEMIQVAVCNLYGQWDSIPKESIELIDEIMNEEQLEKLYEKYRNNEKKAKEVLLEFNENYTDVVTADNANNIIKGLMKRKN